MITEIRLDTQAVDATLIPSKISTAPTDDFTFPRDVTATARLKVGNGTASLPTLTFGSDLASGLFLQAAGSVGLTASGTEYFRVTPARNFSFNAFRTKSGGNASAPDLEVGSATTGIYNGTGGSDFNITVGSSTKLSHNGVQWESFSPVRFTAGSAGVASQSFTGDPDTGTFSPGANTWAVTTNSTEQLRVDTANLTSQLPVLIKATTNQVVLGTGNTTTISATAPAANRVYTLPDVGSSANFIMSEGSNIINGGNTFTADVYIAKQANVSDADIFITSKVGVASPAQGGNLTLSAGDYPGSNNTSSATSGNITITTRGVSNGTPSFSQGGSILLTSGGALVNVGGASGEAHGGGITLTSGDVSQTFGSGLANKTRGGSITLTSGQCATSGDDLGGNITLTSFTPANGGSVVLTGTGVNGTPASPAKGNIYANNINALTGTAAAPTFTFVGDTDTGIFDQAANSLGITTGGSERARVDTVGVKVNAGSVAAPSYSFIGDTDTGFAINASFAANAIDVVTGGVAGFTFIREGVTSNYQLFAQVPGIATRPVYSYWGSSTTGLYFPSSNVGITIGGVETAEFSSSTAHMIGTDLTMDNDHKIILGNSGNAFVKYDSGNGFILWQQDASGTTQFTSNGEFDLYSNTGPNFTGTFSPGIEMYADGKMWIRNDGTTQGIDGARAVQVRFDQGNSANGFNSVLQLNRGNNDDAIYLELGYDDNGATRTGSRIRGANLTVQSLSPLNLVADSINISSLILNQDGTLSAPTYAFASDATTGIYRPGANQLGVTVAGQGIAEFQTTQIRVHKTLQMNSHPINTVSVISAANGSVANPSFSFDSDLTSGLSYNPTDASQGGIFNSNPTVSLSVGGTAMLVADTVDQRLFTPYMMMAGNGGIALLVTPRTTANPTVADASDAGIGWGTGVNGYSVGDVFIVNPTSGVGLAIQNGSNTVNNPTTFTGNATFSTKTLNADGAEATPSYSFTSDTGSGMYKASAQYVGFSDQGTNVFVITSTDDIGLGNPGLVMNTNMDIAMANGRYLGNGVNDPTHPSFNVSANVNGGGLTAPNATDLGLAANGAERSRITSNGIEMQGSSIILNTNGTSGAPAYSFGNDTAAGMYLVTPSVLGIASSVWVSISASALLAPSGTASSPGVTAGGDTTTGLSFISSAYGQIVDVVNSGSSSLFLAARGLLTIPNGTAGAPVYSFATDDTTGMFLNASGILALSAAGTDVVHASSTGLTMQGTSTINMGSNKITSMADPTSNQDAATKFYVDSKISGLTWLAPILEPDTINDSLTTAPVSPVLNTAYIIGASPTAPWDAGSGFGAGHVVYWNGGTYSSPSSWVDVLGRAIQVGDRFGITLEHGSGSEGGSFTGKHNQIAQVTNATPGSYAYTFTTPSDSQAVFVNGTGSQHFGHSYVYQSSSTSWVEFSGPAATPAGDALYYTGNTLNVKFDNSSIGISSNALYVKPNGITYAMSNVVTRETPSGTVNSINVTFTLAFTPASGSEHVYLNGVLQDSGPGNDYTISGGTITFATAPVTGSKLRVTYWKA